MRTPAASAPAAALARATDGLAWRPWGVLAGLLALATLAAQALGEQPQGPTLAFALWAGVALGLTLQRSRFCFLCHARDWVHGGDPRGLLAILLALAVGLVGHTVVVGGWVAVPSATQLPPDLHIGPVSGVLVLAGLSFGAGMVVSGSCISAHWYRLAEGSPTAPWALLGTALGFGLGFVSWNPLYSAAIAEAPRVWLPAHLGHGGALALQLAVLAALAAALWQRWSRQQPAPLGPGGPGTTTAQRPTPLGPWLARLWLGRWAPWTGGLLVGLIGVLVLLRMRPLGVTTTLGSATRALGTQLGWLPERLHGLDGLGGCATLPGSAWLTPHAVLLAGLLAGSAAGALAARQFSPRRPRPAEVARGLGGGVLLGWGAMTGLGCSIGTLLSGTMAGGLSGWVFGLSMLAAVWAGLAWQRR